MLKNITENDQLYTDESWQDVKEDFGTRHTLGLRTAFVADEAAHDLPRPGLWQRFLNRWIV